MYYLTTITRQELSEIFRNKLQVEIEIPGEVTKFREQILDVDFSRPQEVPPTPVILSSEGIATVILHSASDINGKYMRLVVFVYALGGKIFYTVLPSGNYEAQIRWPHV